MRMVYCLQDEYYEEIPESIFEREQRSCLSKFVLENEFRSFVRPDTFMVGKDGELPIAGCTAYIRFTQNTMEILENTEEQPVYFNIRRLKEKRVELIRGDSVLIGKVKLVFYSDCIRVYGVVEEEKISLAPMESSAILPENFPVYKRSPRIIKRPPTEKVRISSAPVPLPADRTSLAMMIFPSAATAAVTIGIGMLMGRGLYLMMSVGVMGVTITTSVVRFFMENKKRKEKQKNEEADYEKHLLNKRKESFHKLNAEEEAWQYNFPDPQGLNTLVHSFSERIYERVSTDADFLVCSIGKSTQAVSFGFDFGTGNSGYTQNILQKKAMELQEEFGRVEKDVCVDFKYGNLGLVGEKKNIHEQLKWILIQLCTMQSYHDLEIIVTVDERYLGEFSFLKWLRHGKIASVNVRGIVYSEKTRDQVLNSMNQILKERDTKQSESKKESRFLPHFLFVVDESRWILDHSIMEFLGQGRHDLGFSMIYTAYLQANLPEYMDTVLLVESRERGRLLLEKREFRDEKIRLQNIQGINLEWLSRNLGTLRHVLGTQNQIPERVSFFDLLDIQHPEELNIEKNWKQHAADRSLAVPLGMRGVGDVLKLDLHEKAHGPHGLVAGTTGSGKSEIIQSYILSMAVHFHPYEVGFLLIDYKGGGMAGLFRNLPHLLGTITNLDGSESMRALASIKSELAARQRKFLENNVNHINGYMELYREGKVCEPIPHLFIISDEFAELKKEQPDFMKELVSTARIGRSLGVHLILATQKPTGVVDDQIWSNSRFKLALKVQNEGDSHEILKTPDAAGITLPGRAYLQVGNNEIYELFQSAWSGALYVKEKEKEVALDNRVYLVNALGQGVLVNRDLSGAGIEKRATQTQLEAIIEHIAKVYEQMHILPVKRPWLLPLTEQILSPYVLKEAWLQRGEKEVGSSRFNQREGVQIALGLVDIPEEQKQIPYIFDFIRNGNLMNITSPGFGKSFFLMTVAFSLAIRYSVDSIWLYVLDFGNNALVQLRGLPHTAEYIPLEDAERYRKFKKLIAEEMKRRKRLLSEKMAPNIEVYNREAEKPLRIWVVLLENYDAIKEMGFEEEEIYTRFSRDGVGLGIYFVVTASRLGAIRSATLNNFKIRIAGFHVEAGEVSSILGRSNYKIPEIKGRVMLKPKDNHMMMQIYAMAEFADEGEYREKLGSLIERIYRKEGGAQAEHLRIMPEELNRNMLKDFSKTDVDVYFGIETEEVQSEGVCLTDSPILIIGDTSSGKTHLLHLLISQLPQETDITICDAPSKELKKYSRQNNVHYIQTVQDFAQEMNRLEEEVIRREEYIEQNTLEAELVFRLRTQIKTEFSPKVFLIDDLSSFYSRETNSEAEIAAMLQRASRVGVFIVATNALNKFYGSDPVTQLFKRADCLLTSNQGHLGIVSTRLVPKEKEAVWVKKGKSVLLRIPEIAQ